MPQTLSSEQRRRLQEVRDGLLELHRALVRAERAVYERDVQRITSSYHLLGLLIEDPSFAWLRELSGLVAAIDELLSPGSEATPEDADRAVGHAAQLVRPDEDGIEFQRRYFESMQRDPDVVIAHGRVRKVLKPAA